VEPITLSEIGQYAIITSDQVITQAIRISGWNEEISGFGDLYKEFSWSHDKSSWSYWTELSQENLDLLTTDKLLPLTGFYVRFRYTLITIGSMTINNITLNIEHNTLDHNLGYVPYNMQCSDLGMSTSSILAGCNGFSPFAIGNCFSLYNDILFSVQNLFGMSCLYLRTNPMKNSGDVIFKEWTLFSMDDPICIKVLVPDNQFPNMDLQYNPYGIEYESPFEVHIVKRNFEEWFGKGKGPQQNDVLYFPLVANRLYQIKSSTLVQDFMMQQTYWKVDLVMYSAKSHTYASDKANKLLEELTVDSYEYFGEQTDKEIAQITKPQQYDRHIGTNLLDPIRKYIHTDLKIYTTPIKNHATVIAEYHYDLSTIFTPNEKTIAVEYSLSSDFEDTDNFAFSCWFKDTKPKFVIPEDPVKLEIISDNVVRLQLQVSRRYEEGMYLQVLRQGKLNFYGKIITVHNNSLFDIEVPDDVIEYLDEINKNWSQAPGWRAYRCFEKVYIDSIKIEENEDEEEEVLGWRISSFAERFFIFNINGEETIFCLPENIGYNWTAMFFNFSVIFKQMNLSFWEIDEFNNTTILKNIYTNTKSNPYSFEDNSEENYILPASNILLTNIRIFNQTVELEKQSNILNQYIIQDADKAILIDNSNLRRNLSYVGNAK